MSLSVLVHCEHPIDDLMTACDCPNEAAEGRVYRSRKFIALVLMMHSQLILDPCPNCRHAIGKHLAE